MNRKSKVLGLLFLTMFLFSTFIPVKALEYDKDTWEFTYEIYRSGASTDNAYTLSTAGTSTFYLGGTNTTFIPITEDTNDIIAGFIFRDMNFTRKTGIYNAYLNLTWYNTISTSEVKSITVYGIAASNPSTYTTKSNFEARSLTTASKVHYVVGGSTQGISWQTIDISNIIQELTNDYIDDNETVELRILSAPGNVDRSAYSYETDAALSASLHIAHSGCSPYFPDFAADESEGWWVFIRENWDAFPPGQPVNFKHWTGMYNVNRRVYICPDNWGGYNPPPALSPHMKAYFSCPIADPDLQLLKRPFNFTDCDVVGGSIFYAGWENFPFEDKNQGVRCFVATSPNSPVFVSPDPPETETWYYKVGVNSIGPFTGILNYAYTIDHSGGPVICLLDDAFLAFHFTSWYTGKLNDILIFPDYDNSTSEVIVFSGAPSAPQFTNEGNNGSLVLVNTEFRVLVSDALTDLDTVIFSTNATGSWVNSTMPSVTGKEYWASHVQAPPVIDYMYYRWYANNTVGTWNSTELLSFEVGQYPVLTISNAEIDGWVFEGKTRYAFEVEYSSENLSLIDQVGFSFTDGISNGHIIWYDRDANTLAVISPEDSISGWLQSLSQTGSTVTAIFNIMFNSPIPDTYDVQASARIVSDVDSGWLNVNGTFSIYNLGGLSTITSSGTAGRIPGGDIFEIYAADTRTRNIVPLQDFDVRPAPLPPGVLIAGVQFIAPGDEEALLDEISNAIIFMDTRTEGHTMYPTNRIITGMTDSAKTYVSWPFGLRIYDNPRSLSRLMFLEQEFFRKIKAADSEIVKAQVFAMVPTTSDTTGRIVVSENGYYPYHALDGALPDRAANLIFAGNGSFRAADGADTKTIGIYFGEAWYNITFVLNMSSRTYDIYIDGDLNASAFGFQDGADVGSLGYFSFLQNLWAPTGNYTDMFIDDVWVHTDFTTDYGGLSKSTMLFNQLQHWSMDFDFFVEDGSVYAQGASGTPRVANDDYSNYGYLEFGWDVMLDGIYVTDFLVARVNITDGYISGKNDWIQFNVTWYKRGVLIKNDILYGLFEGYSLFPGNAKDTCGFHWDMWFNRANASTVVGGRINTEYYGMSDKSVWWAVWSSKWTAMRSEVSESTVFIDLEDVNGTIHSAKDVGFTRSWVKVLRNTESQFSYKVLNIGGLDFLTATDTMSGIDTPPIRETLTPDVPSGFFGSRLGSMFGAALKRLGNMLAGFGMGFFTMSVAFIDNVFSALGYPALVSTIFSWMDSLFASVPTLVGYWMTSMGQIFILINVSAGNTLTQLAAIITIWANMYTITMNLLTGVLTPGINIWNDLGVSSFIQIGAILYPFWLLVYGMENGMQAVIDHVNGVLNIGGFFLNFILNVAGFFMSLLTGLIGAIRG